MPTIASPLARALVMAAIFGTLSLSAPAFAKGATTDSSASSSSEEMDMQDQGAAPSHAGAKKEFNPETMKEHVETRIQNLHAKLKITPDQETAWNDVAQAMRDNEASISDLIQERHSMATTMTAVDDLNSYQKIAQAHADGLQKVSTAFQALYDDMSAEQKKNADEVFGRFEGHRGVSKASAHQKKSSTSGSPSSAE